MLLSTSATTATPTPRPASSSAGDVLDGDLRAEVLCGAADLSAIDSDWDELAAAAVEPNVFYERWNLAPALAEFAKDEHVELLLVYRAGRRRDTTPRLCGLFPLVRRRCERLPVSSWTLWDHGYCYLRTPLIRAGHEREVLHAALDWIEGQPRRPAVLNWPMIDGGGDFAQALVDVLGARCPVHSAVERHNRAQLQRSPGWNGDVDSLMSSHHRRELRRQRRRLAELGQVELRSLRHESELAWWRDSFLRLESQGWKGREQTALAESTSSRAYFEQIIAAAFARGQLQMLGLFLNNEPIALKVNLLSGRGSYGFKIAYDEQYARFSPGVQLELENVRLFYEESGLDWMDSCAVANHFMINRLWKHRRTIDHLLISTGGWRGNLAVGAWPLFRAVKRTFRPSKSPPATSPASQAPDE
jgi:CelD/BcsL family acetyltransferase involved in cellulose biosynthesis